MALRLALIVSIIAVASGFVWVDQNEWNPFAPLKMLNNMFPNAPNAPRRPSFPFGTFNINLPKIPNPSDIINAKPGPNGVYNGVVVKSSSGITRDKDGKIVRTGGTVMISNDNGKVEKFETGTPPDINAPILFPQIRI